MGWADKFVKTEPEPEVSSGPRGARMPPKGPQQILEERHSGIRRPDLIYDNPNPVGPIDASLFATVEDPNVRIQKYAQARFPHDPSASDRYAIVNDEIVYRGHDGRVYPEVSGALASAGDFFGRTALPIAGAILGTIFGGPAGGGVGSMAGTGYRKLAGLVQGDNQDSSDNAREMILTGAIDAAVPAVANKVATKWSDRIVAKDFMKFDKTETLRLNAIAKKYGITLTPAETTKLGSLINQQNRFSTGMDPAGDVMSEFYGARGAQIAKVMDDFVGKAPDLDVAGASARNVAKQAIDDSKSAVSSGSRSAYRSVVSDKNIVPEKAFAEIDADPLINVYINKVKDSPVYGLMDAPRNSTAVIDAAGKLMREEAAALSGTPGMKGQVTESALNKGRDRLLRFMERTYPAYNEARTRQATMRATHLDPLNDGIEGLVSRLKDTSLYTIPDKLLNSKGVSSASVANWRKQFFSQGKGDEWNQLVNSYLRKVWESSATKGRTVKDLSGARFKEMVFGTPSQQKIMREAMGPERFRDFSDLMEVFEATGRASTRQSMTQPAGEAAKAEMRDASPFGSRANEFEITAPQKFLTTWWVENKQGNWRESLAKVITSPDAVKEMEKLRVLRKLSPGSKRKIEVASQIMAKAGVAYSSAPTQAASRPEAPQQPQTAP